MKGIINSTAFRLLVAALAFVTLALSLPPRVTPSAAASTEIMTIAPAVKTGIVGEGISVNAVQDIAATRLDGLVNIRTVVADKNDTPESMMAVAKEGLAAAKEQAAALNDITALTNRLSTDKAYATKLLEAVRKGDSAAVTSVLKETMTRSQFTVHNIKSDFHFEFTILTSKSKYHGCFSNDGSCGGHNVTMG